MDTTEIIHVARSSTYELIVLTRATDHSLFYGKEIFLKFILEDSDILLSLLMSSCSAVVTTVFFLFIV